jgi:hypothetical protein
LWWRNSGHTFAKKRNAKIVLKSKRQRSRLNRISGKVFLKKGCVARAGKEKHTTKEEDLPAPASFIVCVLKNIESCRDQQKETQPKEEDLPIPTRILFPP